jgi:alpha-1,6-mannosyltransferase
MKLSFRWIAAIALLLLMLDSGYFVERNNFTHLFTAYTSAFLLYFFILKSVKIQEDIDFWIKMGFILRGVLIMSIPNFSEDIYRFIWDGRLINLGINPFNFKPSYFFENHLYPETLTLELYSQLNSKNYFTVYPSVCQGIFALAVWLFPKSIYGATLVIKSFLLVSEFGTIFLLKKMLPNSKRILIYILNPLIIIELCGNAHFEAAMIFFFLLSIFLLKQSNSSLLKSSLAYSLSITSKMLSLIFAPFFIKKMGIKRSFYYFSLVGILLIILFFPLFNAVFINNIQSSLKLYFQKFEFNASIYYLLRGVGTAQYGYNPITFISTILTSSLLIGLLIIFIIDWRKKATNTVEDSDKIGEGVRFEVFLWAISLYFLCATTVHPWYAAMPLAISVFTRFSYIALWTSVLPMTYIHYSYPTPTENYWVIGFEYMLVIGFFIYEILFYRFSLKKRLINSEQSS